MKKAFPNAPTYVSQVLKAQKEIEEVIEYQDHIDIDECELEFVDQDFPEEPFKFHYNFNTEVFTDDEGVKRVGVRAV